MFIFKIKLQILLALLFLSFCTSIFSQDLEKITRLPKIVEETSGIELTGKNDIWTINDSGGKAALYLCDTLGNLNKTLKILNVKNRDWEDLAKDKAGNFYIGDIGNNYNSFKQLRIYKISNPEIIEGTSTSAQIISFSFEDQEKFPPSKKKRNFDCESMLWQNGNIYLFTKNRTYPSSTNLYRIPDKPGSYIAEKIGTFYTGKKSGDIDHIYKHWITSADISPDGKKVSLINGKKLWVFYDFNGDDFFGGQCLEIDLGENTQKEAVCFATNDILFITDEYWSRNDVGRNLYKIKLNTIFDQ